MDTVRAFALRFSFGLWLWSVGFTFGLPLALGQVAECCFELFSLTRVDGLAAVLQDSIVDGATGLFTDVGNVRRVLLAERGGVGLYPAGGHGEDAFRFSFLLESCAWLALIVGWTVERSVAPGFGARL